MKNQQITKQCEKCGKERTTSPSNIRGQHFFCSTGCAAKFRSTSEVFLAKQRSTHLGKPSPMKNTGGICRTMNGGYAELIWFKDGQRHKVLEHDSVWMQTNGFGYIPKGCVVHHKNLDKLDNRPENLVMMPRGLHSTLHHKINKIARGG